MSVFNMLSNDIIKRLKIIDNSYVISGSQAVMLYVGHDIRECGDLDVHLCKDISYEDISKELGISLDISYEQIPYQIHKGVRIIELERLLANKLNRLNSEYKNKDIYDLYFLLDLDYDKESLKRYIMFEKLNLLIDEKMDFGKFYYEIELGECIQKIMDSLVKIYT